MLKVLYSYYIKYSPDTINILYLYTQQPDRFVRVHCLADIDVIKHEVCIYYKKKKQLKTTIFTQYIHWDKQSINIYFLVFKN